MRQHFPLINLERILFLSTHQVNIELSNTRFNQFVQLLSMGFYRANQTETIHDFIRNEFRIVAAHFTVVLIIVFAAIFHIGGQSGRQLLRLVTRDQVDYVI